MKLRLPLNSIAHNRNQRNDLLSFTSEPCASLPRIHGTPQSRNHWRRTPSIWIGLSQSFTRWKYLDRSIQNFLSLRAGSEGQEDGQLVASTSARIRLCIYQILRSWLDAGRLYFVSKTYNWKEHSWLKQILSKPSLLHFHPRTKERPSPSTEHIEQKMAGDDLFAWLGGI